MTNCANRSVRYRQIVYDDCFSMIVVGRQKAKIDNCVLRLALNFRLSTISDPHAYGNHGSIYCCEQTIRGSYCYTNILC